MTFEEWALLETSYDSAYKNLALEETLITTQQPETAPRIRIWSNPPATVAGRFQDIHLETDTTLCARANVTVARRFTGGGTVYHDDGNLNFTLVTCEPVIDLKKIQYRNISILKEMLLRMDVESTITNPNSMSVNGKKISGASLAVRRNIVLWHASFLVSTDPSTIAQILSPSREMFATTRVRSRWEPVTNLQTVLSRPVKTQEVKEQFLNTMEDLFQIRVRTGELSSEEQAMTGQLHDLKYSTREWIYEGTVK